MPRSSAGAKYCARCSRTLPVAEFARDKSRADGRMGRCKRCDRARNREYYSRTGNRPVKGPGRRCKGCDGPSSSQRHAYCDVCRPVKAASQMPGRTVALGYGAAHKAKRRWWAPRVEAGGVNCARCGEPIAPDADWDLGHDDEDRSKYTGPEHVRCNRRAPVLRKRAAKAAAKA